ncbi:MAG: hypothetical protein Ct9H300mP27_10600 [Chloroflexota bacterium]|nr:MAG: hypothetical protein Ct9H300mP27_10600 [Chloroflexota bacterium]
MLRIDLDRQLGQLQQEVISLAEIVDKENNAFRRGS